MALIRGRAWSRFVMITRPLFQSPQRWRFIGLLALLLAFLGLINGLNVVNNYVNGHFMTAVSKRQGARFLALAAVYALVFVASTVVAAFNRFVEESLRLRWRDWLTRHLIDKYMAGRVYFRLTGRRDIDNPDQRITEDVKTFTTAALAFLLIGVNSALTLISFSGVLWLISPWLFLAAVVYAVFGSLMTVFLGRKLVKYDVVQLKHEADLRYDLIQVRTQAEPIALAGGERHETGRLGRRVAKVIDNMRSIITLNRNIAFFTEGFNYMIQLIPVLIVGPLYIQGRIEFGVVTQAAMAFAFVMGAFSVIVKEFPKISEFGAVIERLGAAWEVIEEEKATARQSPIEVAEEPDRVAFDGLTLVTPREGRPLVTELSLEVPEGKRLLILGPHNSGGTALVRAAAGLWTEGQGRITRPPLEDVMFLPQHPHLGRGILRDQLLAGGPAPAVPDERLLALLKRVKFTPVLERVGGLDAEGDWAYLLSPGEKQVLGFVRLLLAAPRFAFLDEATSALEPKQAQALYDLLARTPTTFISVSADPGLVAHHDDLLRLNAQGGWAVLPQAQAVGA